eukprot:1043126-Pyramimonas_sp.AAC.1
MNRGGLDLGLQLVADGPGGPRAPWAPWAHEPCPAPVLKQLPSLRPLLPLPLPILPSPKAWHCSAERLGNRACHARNIAALRAPLLYAQIKAHSSDVGRSSSHPRYIACTSGESGSDRSSDVKLTNWKTTSF